MNKTLLVAILSCMTLVTVNNAQVSNKRDDASPLMIGILRSDGTLVPFAQYSNGSWWNPWPKQPEPAESTEVTHHSLAGLSEPWFKHCGKIPTPWFFWSSAGTATILRASKVVQVEAHSGTNWALLTDFPKRSSEDPLHDNIGVAVSVEQKIEPPIEIEPADPQGKDISSFVEQIFNNEETAELDRLRAEKPPVIASLVATSLSSEERAKVQMSITKLYRVNSAVNGEHVYYFEAEKQYQKPPGSRDQGCYDATLFQGWISTQGKGGLGLMESQLMFTDCDRKGPSSTIPVGIMTLKDETFLFVREHGWEEESYTILKLDKSGLHRVLETVGG